MGLFGGGNSSSSTTNNNYDQRQVITTTTDNYDFSDNSQHDNSDRSTKIDNSWSVDNSVTTLLDGGAISGIADIATQMAGLAGKAVNGANQQVLAGYDYADHIFDGGMSFVNRALSSSQDAFERAAQMSQDTLVTAQAAFQKAGQQADTATSMAMAQQQAAQRDVAAAYADAKGTTASQTKILYAVLAVAALMALATMHK
ncbi:hypothetical protein GTP23_12115 [Pseudoduganella sp. FT93W]|uniref:Uncharacterized protein n=1 Tax=Duganella fentianensis TaxID=2692177 RepID=A0A845HY43_9BURK|nr:hypothetical protein [Duganella fentianensis]MYN45792.1 hypothetical protein [Duganella fentianensis]